MEKVRLLVSDEEPIFRECICALLRTCPDFELVGETTSAEQAVEMVRQQAPDVVVLNLAIPVGDSCKTVHLLRMASGTVKILMVMQNEERECVIGGLSTEADGYISIRVRTEELISAVRTVNRGEYFLHPSIVRTIAEDYAQMGAYQNASAVSAWLTPQEKMVLRMLAEGREREDIARSLHVEPVTVLKHRTHIMRKLGISRARLREYANS